MYKRQPGNLIAQSVMEEMDMSFSFFEYAKVGLPILICGIIYFAFIGYKFLPDKSGEKDSSYDEQKDFSNVPKWKQALSLIILVLTLLGMIFEEQDVYKRQLEYYFLFDWDGEK